MTFRTPRLVALLTALATAAAVLATGPLAAPASSAPADLRFTAPTGSHLEGNTDLRVSAPVGTTAVRFYLDGVRLAEITDVYRRQTKIDAPWETLADVGWFPAGKHTLRAEADTPTGTRSVTKAVDTKSPKSRPGVQSLTGGWKFTPAAALPAGDAEGPAPAAAQPGYDTGSWTDVVVPDSIGALEDDWNADEGMVGVYRRTVRLDPARAGEQTALVFQSCFWACRYFVNGTEVGTSLGGYLPTRVDVTDAVRPGDNTVVAVADNRTSTMGEYARPVQGLYWNFGGLLQEVHLERTPEVALTETRAEGTRAGRLTLRPTGVNGSDAARDVEATVTVEGPGGERALGPVRVRTTVPAGGGDATPVTLDVRHPKVWDLDHPRLYTVRLRPEGSAAGREIVERTGFRDVAVDGLDITLNGKPVENLAGFNRHADYPGLGRTQTDGLADREIKALRAKGYQLFRPAHYPTTPAELDAADKYGLLVIEEVNNISSQPGGFLGRADVQEFGKRTVERMISRDRSHPSLFAWSVGNENATETAGAVDYVRNVIAHGRGIDSTRLYTQVSHRHGNDKAWPYQDFFATNYYAGWYSTLESLSSHMNAMQNMTGQPLLLSEYGAEAVYQRPGTGRATEWYQAMLVDEHNRLLGNRPHLLGLMYWTSSEFWCTPTWGSGQNPEPVPPFHTKGLQTLYRDHKLGWRVMFSPVRIARATVLEARLNQSSTLRERVTITDARGKGGSGVVQVDPPKGFTATSKPFRVPPGGTTTVDVTLTGTLTEENLGSQGFVRAVVDADTEALPVPIKVRSVDTVSSPASEDFASTDPDEGWQVVRPDASGWSLTDRPGALRLSTLPGGETGSTNDGRNLFVRTSTPQSDFTASATLEAKDLSADFQQVGLYAYAGDDDYVKVDLGWVDGRRALELLSEQGGRVGTRTSVPYDGTTVQVRLVRRGDDVAAEYSPDGRDWFPIGNAALPGSPKVALQAVGGGASPPVIPTYVDDLAVRTSGAVAVEKVVPPAEPVFTGDPAQVGVTVSNGSDRAVPVEATLDVPAGWTAGTASATVPAFSRSTVQVPVTASGPDVARLTARVTAGGAEPAGAPSADVASAPRGDLATLALDAGTATSPLLSTYQRLTPADVWDPARGFGWVGTAPQSRDRGAPDSLRRDLVTSTAPATLRVAVPAGQHDLWLLVGDNGFASDRMSVSLDGTQIMHVSEPHAVGQFRWLRATVDGGSSGRTADLAISADAQAQFWRFSSLVLTPKT